MRPIDANALLETICKKCPEIDCKPDATDTVSGCLIYDVIASAPTIDAQHVKRGKWIETKPDEEDRKIGIDFRIECSECHDENSHITTNDSHEITGKVFWRSKFCPNCGAKMDGGE